MVYYDMDHQSANRLIVFRGIINYYVKYYTFQREHMVRNKSILWSGNLALLECFYHFPALYMHTVISCTLYLLVNIVNIFSS